MRFSNGPSRNLLGVSAFRAAASPVAPYVPGVGVRALVGSGAVRVTAGAGDGVRVALGGNDVNVADGVGHGVYVALGTGVRVGKGVKVGARVSVGCGVQVGGGAAQIEVGDGPGVMVGRRVALAVGDRKGVAVGTGDARIMVGAVRTGRVSLRALIASAMITISARQDCCSHKCNPKVMKKS